MAVDSEKLPKLEDYVFLSDPMSTEVFIVWRDGRIVQQTPVDDWHVKKRSQCCDALVRLTDLGQAPFRFSWLSGWLPVLCVDDAKGKHFELFAQGQHLLLCTESQAWRFPDKQPLEIQKFDEARKAAREFWERWIGRCRQLSSLPGYLDHAWRSSLVQARMAYSGRHPHYGVGHYGRYVGDGFPPTTLSMVDCLLDYNNCDEAFSLLDYFVKRFIMDDGQIAYYGPSLSEYGGLLVLFAKIADFPGGLDWLRERLTTIRHLLTWIIAQRGPTTPLFFGSPEADTHDDKGVYLHNNAMIWRGFRQWTRAAGLLGEKEMALETQVQAHDLGVYLNKEIDTKRNPDGLVPSRLDRQENFKSFVRCLAGTYANYRYYPELLEAGFLSGDDTLAVIKARETMDGEAYGMTRFRHEVTWGPPWIDDWPLASYARGLLELGERSRFMKALAGHAMHSMTRDTFTAYEQLDLEGSPRRAIADFCVPVQLVLPRMLSWSFQYKKYDGTIVEWGGPEKTLFELEK